MAINTLSIAKSGLKSAIIEALYNEILSNSNNYYYFIGRTLSWNEPDVLEDPQVDPAYEAAVRSEMIFLKKITSADVSYIIPRYNWHTDTVFDMYDDQIGRTQPVTDASYSGNNIYIDCVDHGFVVGDIVKISGVSPDTYNGKFTITYAESDRFAFVAESNPGAYSEGGLITRCSTLGNETLADSQMYCMTNEYHVYKCLNNNNGAESTVKPYSTTPGRLTLSDGYVWKYMYTVPVASRNKFMTLFDVPVTTAIKAPYYSRGSINSVTVNAYGDNYTLGSTTIRVAGNGYLEQNPVRIIGLNITNPGEGYITTPLAVASDPFDAAAFVAETEVLQGVYLKAGKHIYETISGGTTGVSAPTHTSNEIIYNGNVALQYVGTGLTIELTRTGDEITDTTLLGMLGYIDVTNPGAGYTTTPIISISGDGIDAEAACNVTQGRISNITILNRGEDYTTMSVTFNPPFVEDSIWSSEGTVALNDIVKHAGNFYEVTNVNDGTTLGTIAPVHNSGALMNGDVELTFVGATATGEADIFYGYGYSTAPEITVSSAPIGGTTAQITAATVKTNAILAPVIENGQIVSIIVIDGGIGYSSATIDAVGAGEGAEGAIFTANLSYGDLNTNQANIELLAVPGTIDSIKITNPGTGYLGGAPTVTIEGDGTGATATASVANGKLSGVTVTNVGTGYTYANVIIGEPNHPEGIQAKVRAIVSPVEGHGKNAVEELGASDISLFSSISAELNQGFTVENDYRQLGILKNPQQFGTNKRLNSVLGSACYSINASGSDGSDIELDSVILDANDKRFRVVAVETGNSSCLLLLQSIDNAELALSQNLFYTVGQQTVTLAINNLIAPTANKYTGSMLFIDNRNAFQPNAEQTVAMKTAIRF